MGRGDSVAGWILVMVGALGVWGALRLPIGRPGSPEAGFVPLLEAILMGLAGLVLIVQARKTHADKAMDWPTGDARRMILHLTVTMTGYVLLMGVVGFTLSTFIYLTVAIGAWGRYSLLVRVAYGVGITLLIQLTFSVGLSMPLPHGLLGLS